MSEGARDLSDSRAEGLPRLGLVSYLNSRPIGYGLLSGRQRGRFDVMLDVPSKLADSLAAGRIDLALLPSIEYARAALAGRDPAIVPGIAIASRGRAESVLLFSREPIEHVRRVAIDTSSRTSAELLVLLMRRRLRPGLPDPDYIPSPPDLPAMLDGCDAALLIGDRALLASRTHPALTSALRVHDLGEEWMALTGLPFVFAFWAGPRRDDSPAVVAALQDSLNEGIARTEDIARECSEGDPALAALYRDYLTRAMRYTLGREELAGLETYYRLLSEEGRLPGPPPRLGFHRTEACAREPRTT